MNYKRIWLVLGVCIIIMGCIFLRGINFLVSGNQNVNSGLLNFQKAEFYEKNDNNDSVIFFLEIASKDFLQTGQGYPYIKCMVKLANAYKNKRKNDLAEKCINIADSLLKLNYSSQDPLYAELFHIRGTIYLINGNPLKAVENLRKSISLKIRLHGVNDTNLAVTYNNLGNINLGFQNYDSAAYFYQLAIKTAKGKKTAKNMLLPKFKENLAMVYGSQGNYNAAKIYFQEALVDKLKIYKPNSPEEALSYANLGNLELILSNYEVAQDYLNKAEKLYINAFGAEFPDLDVVYLNMGKAYTSLGNYEKALNYYNKSLQLLRKKNPLHPKIGEILMNIGYIYYAKTDYLQAVDFFSKSIGFSERSLTNIKAYRNLAMCYWRSNNSVQADVYFNKSIELARELLGKSNPEVALSLLYYGEFLIKNNQETKGLNNYILAKEIFTSNFGKKNRDLAYCHVKIGEYLQSKQKIFPALQEYQNALNMLLNSYHITDPFNNPKDITNNPDYYILIAFDRKAEAFYQLWKLYGKSEYLVASYNNYKLFAQALEKIRSSYTSDESNILVSGNVNETLAAAINVLTKLYTVTGNKKYLEEAFRFSEKSKSALLLQAYKDNEDHSFGRIPADYINKEKELKNKIAGYKKLLYDEQTTKNPNSERIEFINNGLFTTEKQLDTFNTNLKTRFPAYYKQKFVNNGIDITQLQRNLKNEIIIEYAQYQRKLFIFALSSDSFFVKESELQTDFESTVETLLQSLRGGLFNDEMKSFEEFAKSSNALYRTLIAPVEKQIKNKKLIIIPHGILGYIPFETLIRVNPRLQKPDYKACEYLIKTNCIRYAYLASFLAEIPSSQRLAHHDFVAFAPVQFSKNMETQLRSLPASLDEVKSAAEITNGDIFTNKDATESNFKKVVSDYKIIHLATHTEIDIQNPSYSKILFYPDNDSIEDNLLNTFEISGLTLNAQLAILSGCNTGTGKILQGEGVFNLARGFIYAGVPTIVMTLWELEDNTGNDIMNFFYTNLKDGQPTDEALCNAKLNYLNKADKLYAHPYFWSSYVVIGRSEVIPLNNSLYYYLCAFGLLLLGIILLGIKIYKTKTRTGK